MITRTHVVNSIDCIITTSLNNNNLDAYLAECDEPEGTGICADGTDISDCSASPFPCCAYTLVYDILYADIFERGSC